MLEQQDYILLIFNCQKYRHKALEQKKRWIPNLPKTIEYFHVIGDPELTIDHIFDHHERILYLQVGDDYNSLPKKVIAAFKAILITYNFKYIFKTDDDQEVTNIKFFNTIISLLDKKHENSESRIHYGGHVVDVKQTYQSQYYGIHDELPRNLLVKATKYCSGRFYLLSSDAVEYLINEKRSNIEEEYLEDYAIGYNLKDELKSNMLPLDTNKYFIDFVR